MPEQIANGPLLDANHLFHTDDRSNTPEYIALLKGNDPLRKQFLDAADMLDRYNNGKYYP
ncbi:hypothetical protein ASZ90_010269 [hydrocarbon metagenome]|uniref:Uncharacterized protein n=1 Tax=hydrocarbon metagenome TaxID=938273 RepID=A0A0W8FGJ1_9ZZZZ